jgi:hypothetical protein
MKRSEMISKIASVILNHNESNSMVSREKALDIAKVILDVQKEEEQMNPPKETNYFLFSIGSSIILLLFYTTYNYIDNRFKPIFNVGDCIAFEDETDPWQMSSINKIEQIGKKSYKVTRYSKYVTYQSYIEYRYNNIYKKIDCPKSEEE